MCKTFDIYSENAHSVLINCSCQNKYFYRRNQCLLHCHLEKNNKSHNDDKVSERYYGVVRREDLSNRRVCELYCT